MKGQEWCTHQCTWSKGRCPSRGSRAESGSCAGCRQVNNTVSLLHTHTNELAKANGYSPHPAPTFPHCVFPTLPPHGSDAAKRAQSSCLQHPVRLAPTSPRLQVVRRVHAEPAAPTKTSTATSTRLRYHETASPIQKTWTQQAIRCAAHSRVYSIQRTRGRRTRRWAWGMRPPGSQQS